jgi:hypothetical protein
VGKGALAPCPSSFLDATMVGTLALCQPYKFPIQFSNSQKQFFVEPSLPGSTRQSISFENVLAKIDGCPGQARA